MFQLCVRGRERESEREGERQRERERRSTQKWYYLRNKRSAYFPINRTLHRERETETEREIQREGERERDRKRERCEPVKTQKWYY